MQSTELNDINKYCSPSSLLIINRKGELQRLDCPFRAIVLLSIGTLQQDSTVTVSQVKVDVKLILVYVINNRAYHYYNFSIIL